MIRSPLACSAVLLVSLIGCGPGSLEPATSTTVRSISTRAAAAASTENDIKISAHLPVIVPCGRLGQEIVPFDGTQHVLVHSSFNTSGVEHLKLQTNAQGMTGTGLVSGDTYRVNGVTKDQYEFDALTLPYTNTYVNNFHVESAGATGNIIVHETLKVYVDENGDPTVEVVNFTAECKNFAQ